MVARCPITCCWSNLDGSWKRLRFLELGPPTGLGVGECGSFYVDVFLKNNNHSNNNHHNMYIYIWYSIYDIVLMRIYKEISWFSNQVAMKLGGSAALSQCSPRCRSDRKINSPRQYASADKDDNGRKPRSVVRLPKTGLGHGTHGPHGRKKEDLFGSQLRHNFVIPPFGFLFCQWKVLATRPDRLWGRPSWQQLRALKDGLDSYYVTTIIYDVGGGWA